MEIDSDVSMKQKPLSLEETSFTTSNDGLELRNLINRTSLVIDESGAMFQAEGVAKGGESAHVESRSPHVKKWERDKDYAKRLTSGDLVIPVTKADQLKRSSRQRTDPDELVNCPVCSGEGWDACNLCDGHKTITARAAKNYLGSN